MFKDGIEYDMTKAQVRRAGAVKFHGKTVQELAKANGCHGTTISWHLTRWGNLDRLKQGYHKNRAKVYWNKTRREWHAYIEKHIASDQKIPCVGGVGEAIRRGKKYFDLYVAKKLGQPIPKRKRSAQQSLNQSLAQSYIWVTPAGEFLGKREAATKNGLTPGQYNVKLRKDPINWHKKG